MNVATDTSTAERALGEIARELAGAAAVFRRYGLDYCCGGSQSLGEAAAAAGVDPRAVERDLAALAPAPAEAPEEPLPLIDHILVRYHETHRRELPELIALARRVEERHAGHPQVPRGLTKLLEHMAEALEEHMQKEEQILFPMMRSGATPMVMGPIEVMEHEHVEHGEKLRQLESLTNRHTAPADACTSWLALYAGTGRRRDAAHPSRKQRAVPAVHAVVQAAASDGGAKPALATAGRAAAARRRRPGFRRGRATASAAPAPARRRRRGR